MPKFIPFTDAQKEQAASVDLEEFLRRRGEKLITSGRDKRLASDHSITIRGCEWFDHATEQGGKAISFVKQFYGLSYPEAVSMLLGDDLCGSYPAAKEKVPEPAKPFELPPKNKSMRRVYAYLLQKRCIDREILNASCARSSSTKAVKAPKMGRKNITTPCSSDSMNTAFLVMDTSADCTPPAKATAAISKGATRSTAFIISAEITRSMYSKPLSIYSPISPSTRKTGRSITMWPAAGHPPFRCWRWCDSSRSSGKCAFVWTMTMPVMPPASAWQRF